MTNDICKDETGNVLLVEGADDCHVVLALRDAYVIPKTFGLYQCGSDNKVLKRLNALILSPERPKIIGAMLDVDKAPIQNRWDQIRDKLRQHHYELPDSPAYYGTIVEGNVDKSRLGFWLMPDNEASGMLEDFCAHLAEPRSLAFAQECVEQARQRGLSTFKDVHFSKAIIHTYLAWQDEPGRPLGQSITRQSLQPNTEIATRFTHWLRSLFA